MVIENKGFEGFLESCSANGIELSQKQKERIEKFANLLLKWNDAYNLIGKSTESEIYNRHILDCVQVAEHFKGAKSVLDVGAGAGFPSILLAILTDAHIFPCERIGKKCNFLNHVRLELELQSQLTVLNQDVRSIDPKHHTFDLVTARAFAPAAEILEMTFPLLTPSGGWVLLKGENFVEEINAIPSKFNVTINNLNSITKEGSKIIKITPSST